MFSEIKVKRNNVEEELKEILDELCNEEYLVLDIEDELLNSLTSREREIFATKAALLKVISRIQEDM